MYICHNSNKNSIHGAIGKTLHRGSLSRYLKTFSWLLALNNVLEQQQGFIVRWNFCKATFIQVLICISPSKNNNSYLYNFIHVSVFSYPFHPFTPPLLKHCSLFGRGWGATQSIYTYRSLPPPRLWSCYGRDRLDLCLINNIT